MKTEQTQGFFADGALLIDKPSQISSFGVIEKIQKHLCTVLQLRKRDLPKFGHGGTLDPFATGLLVVCVGEATKLARYFLGSEKSYRATMRWGIATESGDPETPVIQTNDLAIPELKALRAAAGQWCEKPYAQIPPMTSAKKIDGTALYELARKGEHVERKAVECQLRDFRFLSTDLEKKESTFEVTCTAGTYIRTLAEDFARSLGSVAHLTALRRTQSGLFRLEDAITLETLLEQSPERWDKLPAFVPFDRLLDGKGAELVLTAPEVDWVLQGHQKKILELTQRADAVSFENQTLCRLLDPERRLVGVLSRENASPWELERVFPPEKRICDSRNRLYCPAEQATDEL